MSDHTGNRRLRLLVSASIEEYEKGNRQEKSLLVRSLVKQIQDASPHGGFVRREGDRWYEIGTLNAHEKVGHAFRDCLRKSKRSPLRGKKDKKASSFESPIPLKDMELLPLDVFSNMPLKEALTGETSSLPRPSCLLTPYQPIENFADLLSAPFCSS